jgi:hypothetical protein
LESCAGWNILEAAPRSDWKIDSVSSGSQLQRKGQMLVFDTLSGAAAPQIVQTGCFDNVLQESSHSLNNLPTHKYCHSREERQKIRYVNEKKFFTE